MDPLPTPQILAKTLAAPSKLPLTVAVVFASLAVLLFAGDIKVLDPHVRHSLRLLLDLLLEALTMTQDWRYNLFRAPMQQAAPGIFEYHVATIISMQLPYWLACYVLSLFYWTATVHAAGLALLRKRQAPASSVAELLSAAPHLGCTLTTCLLSTLLLLLLVGALQPPLAGLLLLARKPAPFVISALVLCVATMLLSIQVLAPKFLTRLLQAPIGVQTSLALAAFTPPAVLAVLFACSLCDLARVVAVLEGRHGPAALAAAWELGRGRRVQGLLLEATWAAAAFVVVMPANLVENLMIMRDIIGGLYAIWYAKVVAVELLAMLSKVAFVVFYIDCRRCRGEAPAPVLTLESPKEEDNLVLSCRSEAAAHALTLESTEEEDNLVLICDGEAAGPALTLESTEEEDNLVLSCQGEADAPALTLESTDNPRGD